MSNMNRIIANDFAGHLQDAAYSLLALPGLSRTNRFMIVIDLSFFCHFERKNTVDYTTFKSFIRTMLEPFISENWVKSFEFYNDKTNEPDTDKFEAFIEKFSKHWYSIFMKLNDIVEEYKPMRTTTLIRPIDTEIADEAMDKMADIMRKDTNIYEAMPYTWDVLSYLLLTDKVKFICYRKEIVIYGEEVKSPAYILIYLPQRLLRGLPDLRNTFT